MTADVHLIATEASASVSAVCRALDIPRSTAYARRSRKPSEREADNRKLDVELTALFGKHHGRYGSPRLYRCLRAKRNVSRKRVAARMQLLGLVARRPKRFRRTTTLDPASVPAPNILNRKFTRRQPNKAWVGDITYIWTGRGWVYLAVLIDLHSRAIVGWSVSTHCDTELALAALNRAVIHRRPPPGLLHHTDRGSTYTAGDYRARLKALGMRCSMSRKGNCWDNAVAESTLGTIKAELLAGEVPTDIYALRAKLFSYIESYYNHHRMHSSIGYRTPAHHERLTAARGSRAA